jgi:kumamolisin
MDYRPAHLSAVDISDPATGELPAAIGGPGYLTPPQIASAYNIPDSTGYGVKIGIFSLGGGFLQSDLNKSFSDLQAAGLISSSISVPIINTVLLGGQPGIFDPADFASPENTVDVYCVATMAPLSHITMYIGSSYTMMIDRAIADGVNIITISWAGAESIVYEPDFARAAAAGITVLVASGDWGSSVSPYSASLQVCYPASSPYVISVGGTKLTLDNLNNRLSETDDNRDFSFGSTWGGGGGVSTLFSLPSWQSGLYYTPIVNNVVGSPTPLTMRGSPDFSAPMNVYSLYFNGSIRGFGGTSLAAPTLSGILARYQQLTGVQRSSIEWNTIAYANPDAFYDITVGTNNTAITSGYAGTANWDAVTGLGPPMGDKIYKIINTGVTFPIPNRGFRSTKTIGGQAYPRTTSAFPRGMRPS